MSNSRFVIPLFFALVIFGAGVDDTWRKLYGQAQYAAAAKDYVKAEGLFRQAIEEAERFSKDDIRVGSASQGLGVTLRRQKKLAEAEDAIHRATVIYSRTPGNDSIEFAQAHLELASVLMDEGKYEPAVQSLNILLPIFDHKVAPDDGQVAAAVCMQGNAYRMLKAYAKAEPSLKHCADLRSEDGGIASAEFGEAANNLALVYQFVGKYTEADRYFTYAEKIRENTLGILSLELADTLEAHAVLLHQLGRERESKDKAALAVRIRSHLGKK